MSRIVDDDEDWINQKHFCDCAVAMIKMFMSYPSARKKNLSYKGSLIFEHINRYLNYLKFKFYI